MSRDFWVVSGMSLIVFGIVVVDSNVAEMALSLLLFFVSAMVGAMAGEEDL